MNYNNNGMEEMNLEHIITGIHEDWCNILERKEIDVNISFFDAGGNSILMIKVYTKMIERFGEVFSISDFFAFPSIKTLAEFIYQK